MGSSTAAWQLCSCCLAAPRLLPPEAFFGMPQVPWCPPEVGVLCLAVLLLLQPRPQTRPFRKVFQYTGRILSAWMTKLELISWSEGVQFRIWVKSLWLSGLSNKNLVQISCSLSVLNQIPKETCSRSKWGFLLHQPQTLHPHCPCREVQHSAQGIGNSTTEFCITVRLPGGWAGKSGFLQIILPSFLPAVPRG